MIECVKVNSVKHLQPWISKALFSLLTEVKISDQIENDGVDNHQGRQKPLSLLTDEASEASVVQVYVVSLLRQRETETIRHIQTTGKPREWTDRSNPG